MNKKFILFIVEGTNDKREIDALLHSTYFEEYRLKYEPYFWVVKGDLTASKGVTAQNIQQKLNSILLDFRRNGVPFSNIRVQDIQEIVQIVDLDGVFVPYENIVRGEDNKFHYTDEFIITSNVDGAWGRNRKKAEILEKLIGISQIGNVPYSIYYASSNMDHLLFGERSLSPKDKNLYSLEFQIACQGNPEYLKNSVFSPDVYSDCSYQESWRFIQEDNNSLLRYTNINLFFDERAKNPK